MVSFLQIIDIDHRTGLKKDKTFFKLKKTKQSLLPAVNTAMVKDIHKLKVKEWKMAFHIMKPESKQEYLFIPNKADFKQNSSEDKKKVTTSW